LSSDWALSVSGCIWDEDNSSLFGRYSYLAVEGPSSVSWDP